MNVAKKSLNSVFFVYALFVLTFAPLSRIEAAGTETVMKDFFIAFGNGLERLITRGVDDGDKYIATEEALLEKVQHDNELLVASGAFPFGVGFYRKDFIAAPLLVAQYAADIYLFKKIREQRIDHIVDAIETHFGEFESIIRTALLELAALEMNNSQKTRYEICVPLGNHIDQNHTHIGYNPLRAGFFLLAARLGVENIISSLEAPATMPYRASHFAGLLAYYKDNTGTMRACFPVFSLVTIARYIFMPHLAIMHDNPFAARLRNFIVSYFIEGVCGLGDNTVVQKIKKICFSSTAGYFWHMMTIGWAVTMFDQMSHYNWAYFVGGNMVELMQIMELYHKNKVVGQQKLRLFVERGHSLSSMQLTDWINIARENGKQRVTHYLSIPLLCGITYAGYKIVHHLINTNVIKLPWM